MTTTFTLFQRCVVAFFLCGLVACGGEETTPDTPDIQVINPEDSDSEAAGSVLKYKGQLFSIPSPVQAAMLIKQSNIEMSDDLTNSVSNRDNYVTSFQRAMNLGIYGADLGYMSNFDDPSSHLKYFNAIQGLAGKLDIKNNIEPELLIRFANNIERPDSLYALNADLYTAINSYLKDNEQNEIASLILAGGWLEALWISLDKADENAEIRERIGQQKNGLNSLIVLLKEYDDDQVRQFRDGLKELAELYKQVTIDYTYVEPITDPSTRMTYLKSTSSVTMEDATLASITEKVAEIRKSVIE